MSLFFGGTAFFLPLGGRAQFDVFCGLCFFGLRFLEFFARYLRVIYGFCGVFPLEERCVIRHDVQPLCPAQNTQAHLVCLNMKLRFELLTHC
jgi:hypothetical protein